MDALAAIDKDEDSIAADLTNINDQIKVLQAKRKHMEERQKDIETRREHVLQGMSLSSVYKLALRANDVDTVKRQKL